MDKQLLEKLYDAYYQEIYLYVYALCKNHEWAADLTQGLRTVSLAKDAEAQDLTQETFLKALLSLDQSHTNMRAWLYTVARNLYYNEVSKNRRVMYVDEYENETEDRANIPLENILSKERNRLLYHAIEHLPERQREIVMMQYFGGLGQKEIAKVLHMTPENVRVSAHRAKKQMKNYMEGQGYEL